MKYGYLIVYMCSRGADLFNLFGGTNYSISNASLNCAKKVEEWVDKDFEDMKQQIADKLSHEIDGLDGKKIKVEYKPSDIVILNMIEKKVERKEGENNEKDGKDNSGNDNQ